MNELLLIIVLLALLFIVQLLLSRLKQPLRTYIRLVSALLLLVLVWGFAEQDKWPLKLIMTALAISSLTQTWTAYRKQYTPPRQED